MEKYLSSIDRHIDEVLVSSIKLNKRKGETIINNFLGALFAISLIIAGVTTEVV